MEGERETSGPCTRWHCHRWKGPGLLTVQGCRGKGQHVGQNRAYLAMAPPASNHDSSFIHGQSSKSERRRGGVMDVLLWVLDWWIEGEAWGGGVRAPAARCDGKKIPCPAR